MYIQLLLKSSYTEMKQVSWFLIFFAMFSDSFVIKYKVISVKYKSVLWLLHICFFEMQGQILWLIHCRDSFAWNSKANYVTATPEIYLVEYLEVVFCHLWLQSWIFEQKIMFNELWLAQRNFLAICNYIHGL